MPLHIRLKRIMRTCAAPVKGFFSLETRAVPPRYDFDRITFWRYLKEMVRHDTILYFAPFTNAIRYFREERAKEMD